MSETTANGKSIDQTDCQISNHIFSSTLIASDKKDFPIDYDETVTTNASISSTTKMSDDTSSDEDESTNIYSIQLGKPVIISTPIKSASTATMIVPTSNEIIENIKNESIEVIETSHQTLITAKNVPNNNNNNNVSYSNNDNSQYGSEQIHIDSVEVVTKSPRSESPIWTYTLPEPPKSFADSFNSSVIDTAQTVKTETIASDSSDLSDLSTKPMIIDNNVESVIFENIVMTSDIEDGYLGDKLKFNRDELLDNIERQHTFKDDNDDPIQNVTLRQNESTEKIFLREQSSGTNSSQNNNIHTVKNNVLDELNNVLLNQRLDTIIRNNSSDESNNNNIESSKPSLLDNFSIKTYSNNNDDDDMIKVIQSPVCEKIIVDLAETTKVNSVPSRKSSQEYTQIKRTSLTNGNVYRTPRINRSDSFHSTAQHDLRNGFTKTTRSSSYISLFGGTPIFDRNNMMHAGNNGLNKLLDESNRRKSASELSIADLPSLQSLLVMKSILSNSRLNFDSPTKMRSNKDNDEKVVLRNSNHKTDDNLEMANNQKNKICTVNIVETLPQTPSKIDNETTTLPSKNVNTDTKEKKWKYQGPPSINLSTWGDRPKSQIVIKSDTDYKFGGAVINRNTISHTNSEINSNSATVSKTVNVPTEAVTIRRPPRPISVMVSSKPEPIKSVLRPISMIENNHLPIVRGVEYKKNIRPNGNDNESIESIRRPSYEVSTFMPDKQTVEPHHISTMTLGRVSHANRLSQQKTSMAPTFTLQRGNSATGNHQFAPVVKGFKVLPSTENENKPIERTVSTDSGYKSLPMTIAVDQRQSTPPKVSLKPVIVATKSFDGNQLSSNTPFSQFTLRKTGLKDRILADNAASKNTCDMLATKSVIETVCVSPIQLRQKNIQNVNDDNKMSITSAGKRPYSVAEISTSSVPPPPPPNGNLAPPIIRSVITKNHQTIPVEPRDQLLDSIRSFNKSKLRRK